MSPERLDTFGEARKSIPTCYDSESNPLKWLARRPPPRRRAARKRRIAPPLPHPPGPRAHASCRKTNASRVVDDRPLPSDPTQSAASAISSGAA